MHHFGIIFYFLYVWMKKADEKLDSSRRTSNFCNWPFQFKIAGLKWNRQGAASSQCRRIDRMKRTPDSAADRHSLYIPSLNGKCINCAKLGAAKLFMYHNTVGVLPARSVIIAICEILLQKSMWGILLQLCLQHLEFSTVPTCEKIKKQNKYTASSKPRTNFVPS